MADETVMTAGELTSAHLGRRIRFAGKSGEVVRVSHVPFLNAPDEGPQTSVDWVVKGVNAWDVASSSAEVVLLPEAGAGNA